MGHRDDRPQGHSSSFRGPKAACSANERITVRIQKTEQQLPTEPAATAPLRDIWGLFAPQVKCSFSNAWPEAARRSANEKKPPISHGVVCPYCCTKTVLKGLVAAECRSLSQLTKTESRKTEFTQASPLWLPIGRFHGERRKECLHESLTACVLS